MIADFLQKCETAWEKFDTQMGIWAEKLFGVGA